MAISPSSPLGAQREHPSKRWWQSKAATDQGRIRRKLTEEIGLSGAAGAKLDEIEIGFDQWRQPGDKMKFDPLGQFWRLQADGTQNHVDPLVAAGTPNTVISSSVV